LKDITGGIAAHKIHPHLDELGRELIENFVDENDRRRLVEGRVQVELFDDALHLRQTGIVENHQVILQINVFSNHFGEFFSLDGMYLACDQNRRFVA
jgi:hypothetical protein